MQERIVGGKVRRKDDKADAMYEMYCQGYSLTEVGKAFGVTRQSVYIMFKRRKFKLRSRKFLKFRIFNGNKYTKKSDGYFAKTDGKRTMLHRDTWEFYNGKIPLDHDIHHVDGDRSNNSIENLELYTKAEHASRFGAKQNQWTKNPLLNSSQKLEIKKMRQKGMTYAKIARVFNVSETMIYYIINERKKVSNV